MVCSSVLPSWARFFCDTRAQACAEQLSYLKSASIVPTLELNNQLHLLCFKWDKQQLALPIHPILQLASCPALEGATSSHVFG